MSGNVCPRCGGEHAPGQTACHERSLVGSLIGGALRVLEEGEETTAGRLYSAEYVSTQRAVVLLVLRPEACVPDRSGARAIPASLQEQLRAAMQIHSPSVAGVLEMGETPGGLAYAVLEVPSGELLSDVVAARGAVPLAEAVNLVQQAAHGLRAAHDVGIIHGNLSPDAILVRPIDQGGSRLTLISFGLTGAAWRQGGEPRAAHAARGAEYASPEQLAGQTPDERSDVFSLGAVLHLLLTGAPPGSTSRRDALPEVARAVVLRALAPDPAQRFPTISEFADALERAAAFPYPVAIRHRVHAKRAVRRRIPIFEAAAALGAAVGIWLLWSARRAETGGGGIAVETGAWAPPGAEVPDLGEPGSTRADSAGVVSREPDSAPRRSKEARRASRADALPVQPGRGAAPASERRRVELPSNLAGSVQPDSDLVDTGRIGTTTAESASAEPTLAERAAITRRIGLDEATRELGAPLHAIDGMVRELVGLVTGHAVPEADPSRPLVRALYVDRTSGRMLFLDQQRMRPGHTDAFGAVPQTGPGGRQRWVNGNVLLVLHGDLPAESLAAFARRVR